MFKARFDPQRQPHDRKMANFMQGKEVLVSSGFGACRLFMFSPQYKGKVYVTNLRVAFIPDDEPVIPMLNLPWETNSSIQVKSGLGGAVAIFERNDGSFSGIDSTKAMIRDIEEWKARPSDQLTEIESTEVAFMPDIKILCASCAKIIGKDKFQQCSFCLRNIVWPDIITNVIRLAQDHELYVPEFLANGNDSGSYVLTSGTATLVMAAQCSGQSDFIADAERLATAIINKQLISPDDFGPLPTLKGMNLGHENNSNLWEAAKKLPQNLFGLEDNS